jgi:hypothetical protein
MERTPTEGMVWVDTADLFVGLLNLTDCAAAQLLSGLAIDRAAIKSAASAPVVHVVRCPDLAPTRWSLWSLLRARKRIRATELIL